MPRVLVGEMMDAPDVPRDELARSLGYIRFVNARLGGARALLSHLKRWSRSWPKAGDGFVTMIDVATGSADIPVAARRWALGAGYDLRITGVDIHEATLSEAGAYVARQPADVRRGIGIERGDALRLAERFSDGAFDYAHAGLFLHHLQDIEAMTALRIMDRLASRAVIWNDLVRSPLCVLMARAAVIGQPLIVRHDAVASVRAGFTRSEALAMAGRVGLPRARWRREPLLHRFTLTSEKPGAHG